MKGIRRQTCVGLLLVWEEVVYLPKAGFSLSNFQLPLTEIIKF